MGGLALGPSESPDSPLLMTAVGGGDQPLPHGHHAGQGCPSPPGQRHTPQGVTAAASTSQLSHFPEPLGGPHSALSLPPPPPRHHSPCRCPVVLTYSPPPLPIVSARPVPLHPCHPETASAHAFSSLQGPGVQLFPLGSESRACDSRGLFTGSGLRASQRARDARPSHILSGGGRDPMPWTSPTSRGAYV